MDEEVVSITILTVLEIREVLETGGVELPEWLADGGGCHCEFGLDWIGLGS